MRTAPPRLPSVRPFALTLAALFAAACGGDPEIPRPPTGGGGSGAEGGAGGEGGATTTTSGGGGQGAGFATSSASSTSTGTNPCDATTCDPGLQCVVENDVAVCVPIPCDQANCTATEECQVLPNGGAVCVDISCMEDVDCAPAEYCDGTICVDDVCIAGQTSCMGDTLYECASNGSGTAMKATCGSQAYFVSMCVDDSSGTAYCGCQDDWDCPEFMVCDVGQCTGTGLAPTCSLPPVPFAQALPTKEIGWGGTGSSATDLQAVNAPFKLSAQVSMTPVVANLDDDNGDGLINERDFAEILFMTYCGVDVTTNGIVRAIHGGGPNKGKDYFANAGTNVWKEGDALDKPYACADGIAHSTGNLAVADLDGDGVPEIVFPNETTGLTILDNTGAIITSTAANQFTSFVSGAVTIANLDNKGFAELVVGRTAFTLGKDANGKLIFVDRFEAPLTLASSNGQGPVSCVANLAGDARPEIVSGAALHRLPTPPPGVTKRADCAVGATDDFCTGKLSLVWDGGTVNGLALPTANRSGFCAVADVLGAIGQDAPGPMNPLDGKPEVILISQGTLVILDGPTGQLKRLTPLNAGTNGGAPNVDDFDGDGYPEIGTAFGLRYLVIDLQETTSACPAWPNAFNDAQTGLQGNPARNPGGACTMNSQCGVGAVCNTTIGQCTCLHNGWQRVTEDDSSRVTSSSVFDFNGDGAAEVVYNDECFFRVYEGKNGAVLFKQNSPSRTRIENPVIADVDNDGNAEIVFCSNNDAGTCSVGINHPNGIQVWGDASDSWVSARRIYNQHAYHVTNVTESNGVPATEPESWKTWNGRFYNTYRSNPRSFGVAPDLVVSAVQYTSPGETCGVLGSDLDIAFEIKNQGDLRVGPGVTVRFEGTWPGNVVAPLYEVLATMKPLEVVLGASIEPGQSILLTVAYDALQSAQGVLPDQVRVIVDALDAESECVESNNDRVEPVTAGATQPDLVLTLGSATNMCPPSVATTVTNQGTAPAPSAVVRYYAGNPQQGGSPIFEITVPGPIAPGQSVNVMPAPTLTGFPGGALDITVYGIVDPDKLIPECNDANNGDAANNAVSCAPQ